MAVVIACVPAAPVAKSSACAITVTGLTLNDTDAHNVAVRPEDPEVRYYITFELDAEILGKSPVFAPTNAGKYDGFFNYIFPKSGSWTVRVSKYADDSSVQTQAVTVS